MSVSCQDVCLSRFRRGLPARIAARALLVDRLINAFHQSLKHGRRHGSAATQLIAGGAEQVLAFLDRLAVLILRQHGSKQRHRRNDDD
jgi:hypothetical protein